MSEKRLAYMNDKQIALLEAKQPLTVNIWGRGTGKSVVAGVRQYQRWLYTPRSKTFFCSTTFKQILQNILPVIKSKWEDFGLIQDQHYVVGRKPPSTWQKPYAAPDRYENIITFFNGYTIQLMSMDNPDSQRGGSFDGGEIDEMAFIPKEHINRALLPSVRGNRHKFSHWLHQQVNCFTSMPWKSTGQYVLEYADKAILNPDKVFYSEANVYDNILVLGQKGIDQLEQSMSYLEFQIEVLNQRLVKVPDGFYPTFNETIHLYQPRHTYKSDENGYQFTGTEIIDPHAPIDLTFDFGGWFSCCIALQERNDVEYGQKSFYVKDQDKLDVLIDNFCRYFSSHEFKHVNIYGEPRGHDRMAIGESLYATVQRLLEERGWSCTVMVEAQVTDQHDLRFQFMNEILQETDDSLPKLRLDEENCKDVAIAVQTTGIKPDFKKDKSKERDRNYPQQHATHFTDALDYYFMQKYYHRVDFTIDEADNWWSL